MRLQGKVALIAGAARGMGAAEARLFAREGASVRITDVTSEDGWARAVDTVVGRFGRLDILVNNAGIFHYATLEETTAEDWDRIMDVNAKGVFLDTHAAIPAMRRTGGGSIVNISSGAGLVGGHRSTAYNASKGAVRILTKSTAIQHAREGIRANSVHPGAVVTDMTAGAFPNPGELGSEISDRPIQRFGTPEEIAYGVLFLASDESSYMTGSELVIDGGRTAQ